MKEKYSYDELVVFFDIENMHKPKQLEHFYKIIGKSNSVLDVPCATGFRIQSLMENYNKILCFDLSEEMLKYCSKKYMSSSKVLFKKGDLKNILDEFTYVDDVFILDYALYFLSIKEIENLIRGIRNKCQKLIIELFNYNRMTYKKIQKKIGVGKDVVYLLKNYSISKQEVLIDKKYIYKNKTYTQKIKLFNTPTEKIFEFLEKQGVTIRKLYKNYNGDSYRGGDRCIVVIEFN